MFIISDPYIIKLAESAEEKEQVYQLRYNIFVLEQQRTELFHSGDKDQYDDFCDHLIVIQKDHNEVIGTYRLISGARLMDKKDFYSNNYFQVDQLSLEKDKILELGRACIKPEFRNGRVLQLLWEGIAHYVLQNHFEYLIGIANIEQKEVKNLFGIQEYLRLKNKQHDLKLKVNVRPDKKSNINRSVNNISEKEIFRSLPPLMKGYLALGAYIEDDIGYDPEWETYDFFVVLSKKSVSIRHIKRIMGSA